MTRWKLLYSKTLFSYFAHELWMKYYWKFVLPKITEITLDGLRLDVSDLPLKVRNRMLHIGYEKPECEMCKRFLQSRDGVLEIGGAIGFIGLFCQKKIGIRDYTSVEANPRTVALLRRNYELNGLMPRVWNLALADTDGQVELEVGSDFWENSIVGGKDFADGRKVMDVPAATFRTLLSRVDHPVNVLIIDIEGAEQFIDVEAIPDTIAKIIIEMHPKVLGPQKMYEIISNLIVRGFRVAREEEGTFVFLREAEISPEKEIDLSESTVQRRILPKVIQPMGAALSAGI